MRIIAITLFSLLIVSFISPEEKPIRLRVMERIAQYNQILPQEKAYLQVDKPYYHPRDTIWLKAYLVDAIHLFPDSASSVLYVDLVDEEKGKLLTSTTLRVNYGFAAGNITMPEDLAEGHYKIRSYTNWMKNVPSSFFQKDIHVYRDIDRSYDEEKLRQLTTIADAQFFPEGGDMVTGLSSRVAFKAVNAQGKGTDGRGFILNSKNDTVISFHSVHLGMGYFNLKPEINESYTAHMKIGKGKTQSFPFPAPIPQGFVMALDNITRKDEVRIYISHNYSEKKNVTLIVHQRGVVRYAADVQDAKGVFMLRVPKINFPDDGIVHFTLFSEEGKPLCERLAFHNTDKRLLVEFKPNKPQYQPREKVEIEIQVKDSGGSPVEGNFSLAVTDNNQLYHESNTENIFTYLLLGSDVKRRNANAGNKVDIQGTIEQPAWYFDKGNSTGPAYLDMLLMTQGWRRFVWDDILATNPKYDTTNLIEFGLPLSGTLLQKNGQSVKQPVPFSLVLTAPGGANQFAQGTADTKGRFSFNNLDFNGRTLIKATQGEKEKKLKFTFDSLTVLPVPKQKRTVEALGVSNEVLKSFLAHEKQSAENQFLQNKMLNEIVVKAYKIEKDDSRKNISGTADKKDVVNVNTSICASAQNVFQLMQNRVAGLKITRDNAGVYRALLRSNNSFGFALGGPDPLYVIDGIPVDGSAVNFLSPCDVEQIQVFKGPNAIWGSRGNNGVIAFYMRKVMTEAELIIARQNTLIRTGYTWPRQFYSPRYDQPSTTTMPDIRSTVFWEPNVVTDKQGKAKIQFWNSDESDTEMKVILEGMNYNGKFAVGSTSYPVKK